MDEKKNSVTLNNDLFMNKIMIECLPFVKSNNSQFQFLL